mmetsp:Transcript_15608/g.44833  ORF Transcript_15608/g.44833 Transcript_15608/m.44833 type:complete len:273 (+) Transcript_15608:330-1148(+)
MLVPCKDLTALSTLMGSWNSTNPMPDNLPSITRTPTMSPAGRNAWKTSCSVASGERFPTKSLRGLLLPEPFPPPPPPPPKPRSAAAVLLRRPALLCCCCCCCIHTPGGPSLPHPPHPPMCPLPKPPSRFPPPPLPPLPPRVLPPLDPHGPPLPGPPQQPAGRTPGPQPPDGSQSGGRPSNDCPTSISAAGPPQPKPLPIPLQDGSSPPQQPPLPRPPPRLRAPFAGPPIIASFPPPLAACSARLRAAAVGADGSTLMARPLTNRPCKVSMAN